MPLNPDIYVTRISNAIRITDTALLDLISKVAKNMLPIHKSQLIGLKDIYRNKDYFSKTEFMMALSIFKRYQKPLLGLYAPVVLTIDVANSQQTVSFFLPGYEKVHLNLIEGFAEAEKFEERIVKLEKEYTFAYNSNHSVLLRPDTKPVPAICPFTPAKPLVPLIK